MMSIELQLLIVFPVLIGAIYIVYKMFKSCIGTAFNKGVKSVLFNPDYKTDCSQDDGSKSAIYEPYSAGVCSEIASNQSDCNKENNTTTNPAKYPFDSLIKVGVHLKHIIKKVKSYCQRKKNDTTTIKLL